MRVSQKPLTQLQMKDILLGFMEGSIKSTQDIAGSSDRQYYEYHWVNNWFQGYLPPITQYKVPDDVKDYDNYTQIAYLPPNQETWSNEYVKYVFPDDFDKVPEGSFGRNWKNTKYGIIGNKNIFIKPLEKTNFNIVLKVWQPKYSEDNYTVRVRMGQGKIQTEKVIVFPNNSLFDIKAIDADFFSIWFDKNIVIDELEFIPLDTNGIDYHGAADFNDIALGGFSEGFYSMEYDADRNYFIWSSGKNEIKLFPPSNIREDLHFTLFMKPFHIRDGEPQRVTFSKEGNIIADFPVNSGSLRLYNIVIPKELLKQGETISLDMELAYTDSPHKLTGSSDTRELGMMICSPEKVMKELTNNANNTTPVSAVPHVFVSGWYGNEGSHIWGGKIAELILPIDNKLALYEINGGMFLNKEREPQKIEFMIGDDILSSFTVNDEDNRNYAIFIPEKYSAGKNFITLKIKTSYETAPNSFMDTSDDRQLAFKINSIKYETASAFKELFAKKRVSVKDIPNGLFLNGWYDKENDYIWGGEVTVLLIPFKSETKEAAISLEAAAYINRDAEPQTISFFAGDRLLGEYTADDDKYKSYDIIIPEDILKDGVLPLTIKTTYSAIPKEDTNADDNRRLAVRVKSVRIKER